MTAPTTELPAAAPGSDETTPFADRVVARADATGNRVRHFATHRLGILVLVWRLLSAAVRGSAKTRRQWWTWVRARELDKACRESTDLVSAHKYRRSERRTRAALSAGAASATALVLLVAVAFVGVLVAGTPLLLGGGTAAARAGRRDGERLTGAARKPARASQDTITEALREAGVIGASQTLKFVEPVTRDGQAWAALVDLPANRKASSAVRAKEDIASALAVDEARLDIQRVRGDGGHAGRLSIWCAGSDPYAARPERSPLADAESWDFWQPFRFGRDARGRAVEILMLWTHLLIGSIPRIGKTFSARLVASAAALDPYVRLVVWDGKNGIDWLAFRRVAYRFGKGVRPKTVQRLDAVLTGLVGEMNDRYDRLAQYSAEDVPEGKITPGISRDPDAGMPLVLVAIDEVHRYLESSEFGSSICASLVELAKVGPAVGIILLLATQKPDADSIPTELRDVLGTRLALKTMTWQASDTILGAGSYKAGYDASKFLRSHKGVGILLGADDEAATDEPVTVRTDLLNSVDVRAICERGRQLRIAAGTLEGDAAGDTDVPDDSPSDPADVDVLALVRDVFGDAEELRSVEVCERLKAAGLDVGPQQLAALLAPFQVFPADIRFGQPSRPLKGYRVADICRALERRDQGATDPDVP